MNCVHKLGGFVGVHTRGGLVEEEKLGVGCERARNFKLALFTVRKVRRHLLRLAVKLENPEQFERLLVRLFFFSEISRKPENAFDSGIVHMVVKPRFDVIKHAHILEKSDILESAGYAVAVDSDSGLARDIFAVEEDTAGDGLINAREHIKDCGFAGAVRTDKPIELSFSDGHIKPVDGAKSSELN